MAPWEVGWAAVSEASAALDAQVSPLRGWQLVSGLLTTEPPCGLSAWLGLPSDGAWVLRARAPRHRAGGARLLMTRLGGPRKSPPPHTTGRAWMEGRRTLRWDSGVRVPTPAFPTTFPKGNPGGVLPQAPGPAANCTSLWATQQNTGPAASTAKTVGPSVSESTGPSLQSQEDGGPRGHHAKWNVVSQMEKDKRCRISLTCGS